MSIDWREAICAELRARQPDTLCVLDPAAYTLAESVSGADRLHRWQPHAPTHFSLALGVDVLDGLDPQQAMQHLSQVRLFVPTLMVVAPADCRLGSQDFLALGFSLLTEDTIATVRLYQFDLPSYKPAPEWLNARYWAHPERWKP